MSEAREPSTAARQAAIERIVEALRPYDIPTGRSWFDDERVEPATKALDALLEDPQLLADLLGAERVADAVSSFPPYETFPVYRLRALEDR